MSKDEIIEGWNRLEPHKKQKAVKSILVLSVVLVGIILYYARDLDEIKAEAKEPTRLISLGDNLLEDDIKAKIEKDKEAQEEQNKVTERKLKDLNTQYNQLTNLIKNIEKEKSKVVQVKKPIAHVEKSVGGTPPPDYGDYGNRNRENKTGSHVRNIEREMIKPELVGGITRVSGKSTNREGYEKKKAKTFKLSPGFMEAQLLTGIKADTVQAGDKRPQPMLLRIQKPAILPNHIKANLKGCFIIANGHGYLASERVDGLLVSLNCTANNGASIINSKISGYMVDEDGSKGLKGRVVYKAGQNIARAFAAGMIDGAGKAIAANNKVTVIDDGAVVEALKDSGSLFSSGLGQGISEASSDIKEIFIDLIEQTSPVIEIGPTKKVTIVITDVAEITVEDIEGYASNG